MNKAVIAALLGSASATTLPKAPQDDQLIQIVSGMLKGALHAEGFDDITHCIQDAKHVISDAEAAYKDFKGHSIS
jgi:hypothetical protein